MCFHVSDVTPVITHNTVSNDHFLHKVSISFHSYLECPGGVKLFTHLFWRRQVCTMVSHRVFQTVFHPLTLTAMPRDFEAEVIMGRSSDYHGSFNTSKTSFTFTCIKQTTFNFLIIIVNFCQNFMKIIWKELYLMNITFLQVTARPVVVERLSPWQSWAVNRQLCDTPSPCPWSCSFGWCLGEGLESESSTAPTGCGPWTSLLTLCGIVCR